jgi:hypothetical protein
LVGLRKRTDEYLNHQVFRRSVLVGWVQVSAGGIDAGDRFRLFYWDLFFALNSMILAL